MTENALRYLAVPLLAALLISCSSGPESGDMYEHTATSERIEIDTVGGCGALVRHYERQNEKVRQATDSEAERLTRLVTPYLHADSTDRCFAHKKQEKVSAGAGQQWQIDSERHDTISVTVAHLRALSTLEEDYKRADEDR